MGRPSLLSPHFTNAASSQSPPSISLVLPAWNEVEVIGNAIEEADAALRELTTDYEIIVVDDGSSDGTANVVNQAASQNDSVRLVRHEINRGYGASLRSGFTAAKNDLVAFSDADCQFDLSELDRFILLSKKYDIVCGYRIDRKDSALRCFYSRCYNQLVRLLLGITVRDVDCAVKMFHRDTIKSLTISTNGFLVNSELLVQAKQKNCSLVEVGVTHRPRLAGTSTVSITHIPVVLASLFRYWWNKIQFPGAIDATTVVIPSKSQTAKARSSDRWLAWCPLALLLIAALFMFTNLNYPLIDRDETRYGEIPREMLATSNWILPQLNFKAYYDKPPLLYWLCATSYKIFGVSNWSARLVPAIAALATLAATLLFGSRVFGKRAGLISAVVLFLSVGFAFSSRYLLIDGVLALLVTLAFFTSYEAIRGPNLKLGWWLLSAIILGLGFLTKGPIALVLWMPPLFLFSWLSNAYAKPQIWHYGLTFGVVAAIVAPWLIAVSLQDANFVPEFFLTHNLKRFAGEFHAKPIWFFIPVLLVAGHPWSFLTIPYVKFLFSGLETTRQQRPPVIGFLFLWSMWCFTFFSLSSCKLPTYLLPAAPAFALMIGHYLDKVLSDSSTKSHYWFARFWSARTATASTCLAGVGFTVFALLVGLNVSITTCFWGVLWASLLACSLLLLSNRKNGHLAWATTSGLAFLFVVMMMHQLIPEYSRSQTLFGIDSPLSIEAASEQQTPIATIAHEFSEVPFYLNRSDVANFQRADDERLVAFLKQHGEAMLVLSKDVSPNRLRSRLPLGTEMKLVGEQGPAKLVRITLPTDPEHVATKPGKEVD